MAALGPHCWAQAFSFFFSFTFTIEASSGYSSFPCAAFSLGWLRSLRSADSRHRSSAVVKSRLSCCLARRIYPDQGSTGVPYTGRWIPNTGLPGKPSDYTFKEWLSGPWVRHPWTVGDTYISQRDRGRTHNHKSTFISALRRCGQGPILRCGLEQTVHFGGSLELSHADA